MQLINVAPIAQFVHL